MKIGLVGSCGHLGAALLRELGSRFSSAEIVAIDDLSTGSANALLDLDPRLQIRYVEGDVRTLDLRSELGEVDVAVSLLPPIETGGRFAAIETLALFLARRGIPLLHLSSTSVYGSTQVAKNETSLDALAPGLKSGWIAGLESLGVEYRLREIAADDKLHYSTLRLAPLVGFSPAMHFRREPMSWIWDVVRGVPPEITPGILESSRPYLTVKDACTAVSRLLEQERFDREPWNIFSAHCTGEQFFSTLRVKLPAIVHRWRVEAGRQSVSVAPLEPLLPLELSRKKLERIAVALDDSPVKAYQELIERLTAVFPRPPHLPPAS